MGQVLRQLAILIRLNLKAGFARPKTALTAAGFMFANNLIFFIVWVVFFSHFSSIRGWQQADVALLIGIVAWAVGSSLFLAGGMRDIARAIVDGNLDVHLGRPTHPLPSLIFSRSIPAGLGDMATALLFWFTIGGQSLTDLPSLLLVGTAAAFVFVATNTIVQAAAFWIPGMVQLAEEVLSLMILVSAYPQHTFGFGLKLVLYTVFPTAFIGLLPVEAIRDGSLPKALGVMAAAAVYASLAVLVFNHGLRRYTSGNRIVELR